MPIRPATLYTHYHTSDIFTLHVKQTKKQSKIIMQLNGGTVNTKELPQTFPILKKILPSVLKSTCYNDDNYLCLLKVSSGFDNVEMSGLTKWNWILHPKGTFHITVSAGIEDTAIFAKAMASSIELTNLILMSGQQIVSPHSPYQLKAIPGMYPAQQPESFLDQASQSN
jgi:hypothetical protein